MTAMNPDLPFDLEGDLEHRIADDPDVRRRLRVAALVHDTWKRAIDRSRDRVPPNEHGFIAARWLKRLVDDAPLVALVELHDESYRAWRAHLAGHHDLACRAGTPRCLTDKMASAYDTLRTHAGGVLVTKREERMKTHTTLDLDRDLLAEAAAALGTSRTTDTVHAALREAVARQARARLMARDWSNLKGLLPEMRAPRAFLPQSDETAAALAELATPGGVETAASRSTASRHRR